MIEGLGLTGFALTFVAVLVFVCLNIISLIVGFSIALWFSILTDKLPNWISVPIGLVLFSLFTAGWLELMFWFFS